MINKYLIFITILFFQYLWDRLTTNCITLTGELLLFIHHLIDVYVFLGGILFNPLYHLIFVILVLIHWITNNNRCQVTIVTNKYCGYPYEYKFQDLIQKFKLQNKSKIKTKSNSYAKKLNMIFKGLDIDEKNILNYTNNNNSLKLDDYDSIKKFNQSIFKNLKPKQLNIIVTDKEYMKKILFTYYKNHNLIIKNTNDVNIFNLNSLYFDKIYRNNDSYMFKDTSAYLLEYDNNYSGSPTILNYYNAVVDKKEHYPDSKKVLRNDKYLKFIQQISKL